jgi:hypothetical protein
LIKFLILISKVYHFFQKHLLSKSLSFLSKHLFSKSFIILFIYFFHYGGQPAVQPHSFKKNGAPQPNPRPRLRLHAEEVRRYAGMCRGRPEVRLRDRPPSFGQQVRDLGEALPAAAQAGHLAEGAGPLLFGRREVSARPADAARRGVRAKSEEEGRRRGSQRDRQRHAPRREPHLHDPPHLAPAASKK